jgi:large subunit ribosomal protein L31
MKTGIHPKYHLAKATCESCGAVHTVGSTMETISSQCHPLFTGLEKSLDTGGRVEKFRTRAAAATTKKKK